MTTTTHRRLHPRENALDRIEMKNAETRRKALEVIDQRERARTLDIAQTARKNARIREGRELTMTLGCVLLLLLAIIAELYLTRP